MLDANYKTACSVKGIVCPFRLSYLFPFSYLLFALFDAAFCVLMLFCCVAGTPPDFSVKDLVHKVLEDSQFAEQRARKLDIEDFLRYMRVRCIQTISISDFFVSLCAV